MRLLAAALVAVIALGCKNTLHWRAIENDIRGRLAAQHRHAEVTCPETEVRAHLKFDCQAVFDDAPSLDVHVELLDQVGSYQMSSD